MSDFVPDRTAPAGLVLSHWRATYVPGQWVVLSGPTSLVAFPADAPSWAALIPVLWEEVVAATSIGAVATRLAEHQVDQLPSFAALFWSAEGMRSLVRGAVVVRDADSGEVLANGDGIQTWSETALAHRNRVVVDLEYGSGDAEGAPLPLVVGAVRASAVTLDASETAVLRSPQLADPVPEQEAHVAAAVPGGAAPVEADAIAAPEVAADEDDFDNTPDTEPMAPFAELDDDERPGPPAPEDAADEPAAAFVDEVEWGQWGSEPTQTLPDDDASTSPKTSAAPRPTATDTDGDLGGEPAMPVTAGVLPPPIAPPVTAEIGGVEDADTALMAVPFIPPVRPAPPAPDLADTLASQAAGGSLILASVCSLGHASAPGATTCRLCGAAIPAQSPQLVSRPVIARVHASDGSVVDLDRPVLIGRAPSESSSTAELPRLMTVPSPGHDISRTHLQVAPDGWDVVVTDLNSTNGTMWTSPGAARQLLKPGEPTIVAVGTELELGDGVGVRIEPAA